MSDPSVLRFEPCPTVPPRHAIGHGRCCGLQTELPDRRKPPADPITGIWHKIATEIRDLTGS